MLEREPQVELVCKTVLKLHAREEGYAVWSGEAASGVARYANRSGAAIGSSSTTLAASMTCITLPRHARGTQSN